MKETDSGEKERWEEIATTAAQQIMHVCGRQFDASGGYDPLSSGERATKIILSAIAESHQSKTEQPEPECVTKFVSSRICERGTEGCEVRHSKKKEAKTESVKAQTQNALLPCPFCGSDNLSLQRQNRGSFVECINCGVSGAASSQDKFAIEYWNERAAPSVGRGNEAGAALLPGVEYCSQCRNPAGNCNCAALLSKESEKEWTVEVSDSGRLRTLIDHEGNVLLQSLNEFLSDRICDAHSAALAPLQRKLSEAEQGFTKADQLYQAAKDSIHDRDKTVASQRDVIEQMRKALELVAHVNATGVDDIGFYEKGPVMTAVHAALVLSSPVPTEVTKL